MTYTSSQISSIYADSRCLQSWIAQWWGNADAPLVFFPFVGIFGGLGQFSAALMGFKGKSSRNTALAGMLNDVLLLSRSRVSANTWLARDTLVTVINGTWGCFWISIGILYAFVATGAIPPHSIDTHFPQLASWFVVLTFITWSGALAATARDLILCITLFSLAIGSTIACCLFAYGTGVKAGIKAAAYFWIISSLAAWWRVTVYMLEEAYGPNHVITKFFPIFRTPQEKKSPYVIYGLGEPGVKRGVPKPLPV